MGMGAMASMYGPGGRRRGSNGERDRDRDGDRDPRDRDGGEGESDGDIGSDSDWLWYYHYYQNRHLFGEDDTGGMQNPALYMDPASGYRNPLGLDDDQRM